MIFDDNGISEHGVLPVTVDTNSNIPDVTHNSALRQFIADSTGSTNVESSNFISTGMNVNGVIPVKPPSPAWDQSGWWGDSGFNLDPSGSGNYIYESYIPKVEITGQRPSGELQIQIDPWWNFPTISIGGSPGSNGLPMNTDPCVGGAGNKVDWNFIGEKEGAGSDVTKMTVPVDTNTHLVLDHSGPTIAHGFDVGNHSVQDMQKMGLSQDLINALTPYAGPNNTGQKALDFVNAHPLTITSSQVAQIDAASHSEALARVVGAYDSATGRQGSFWALPQEAQTVIFSISYQYGSLNNADGVKLNPMRGVLWNDFVNDNWTKAVDDLRNFGDKYTTRRNSEANYLNAGILSNTVHNGSPC